MGVIFMAYILRLSRAFIIVTFVAWIGYAVYCYISLDTPAKPAGSVHRDMGDAITGTKPLKQQPLPVASGMPEASTAKGKEASVPMEEASGKAAEEAGQLYLTPEEIGFAQKLGFSDKMAGLLLISKIDKGNSDRMLNMAKGGITNEEKEVMWEMLKDDLSDRDMAKLEGLIEKCKRMAAGNR